MSNLLITVASWEERFRLGYKRIVKEEDIGDVVLFSFAEYGEWNSNNLKAAKKTKNYEHVELSFREPKESWLKVTEILRAHLEEDIIFDMSTAPRNITWTVLDLFDGATGEFTCIYNKPVEYGKWLSRNPGKPRIVYKLGGELQLGWPTKLLVLPGYDAERVKQLIDTFEPIETVLGCHDGKDLENMERKVTAEKIKAYEPAVRGFDFNAYSGDLGLQKIMSEASDLFKDANVIMASLGPKVTAIPLYRIHKKYPNSALVYTPSKEFEQDYSKGIGEHVVIDPRTGKRAL